MKSIENHKISQMKSSVTEIHPILHYCKRHLCYWLPQRSDVFSCYYELIPPFAFSFNHFGKYPPLPSISVMNSWFIFLNSAIYPETNKYYLNHTALSIGERGRTDSTDLHINLEFGPKFAWLGRLEGLGWILKEIRQMLQVYVLIWAWMRSS